jgi:hypothetical protein
VFVLLVGWTMYPVARLQYIQQRDNAKLERQLAGIRKRNGELKREVDRLKTPAGVEEAARERLGFVKKGEQMYVVMPEGKAAASGAATAPPVGTASVAGGVGVWESLLDAVFGVGR